MTKDNIIKSKFVTITLKELRNEYFILINTKGYNEKLNPSITPIKLISWDSHSGYACLSVNGEGYKLLEELERK